MLTKTIILVILLGFLMFNTLQILAEDCLSQQQPFPNEKKVVVNVTNSAFVPDCLIIHDGQSVVWVWEEDGEHTVTSNAGPFGDCNDKPSAVLQFNEVKGHKDDIFYAGPFKYDPKNSSNNVIYYNCIYHCYSGMIGKINIVRKKKSYRISL